MDYPISSDQIFLFKTIVEKGSFSKAAQQLGLHVSTVTRQIDRLEESIGAKLFIRSSHFIGLTESGDHLYRESKEILKHLSSVIEDIRQIENAESGEIKISCLPTFCKTVIIPILKKVKQNNQDIQLSFDLTERLVDPIVERLDLAIRIGDQPNSTLYSKKLGEQTWHICASPDLASKHRLTHIDELENMPLIKKYSKNSTVCWNKLEERNHIAAKCDDFHGQLMLAIEGIGFCCLPNWVVHGSIQNGSLVHVLHDPFQRRDTIYALRPFKHPNAKSALLMDEIERSLDNVSTGLL